MLWILAISMVFSLTYFPNVSGIVFNSSNGTIIVPPPEEVRIDYEILDKFEYLFSGPTWEEAREKMGEAVNLSYGCERTYNVTQSCTTSFINAVRNDFLSMSESDREAKYHNAIMRTIIGWFGVEIVKKVKNVTDPETNTTTQVTIYKTVPKDPSINCEDLPDYLQLLYKVADILKPGEFGAAVYDFFKAGESYGTCIDMATYYWESLEKLNLYFTNKETQYNASLAAYNETFANFSAEGGCGVFPEYCEIEVNRSYLPYLELLKGGNFSALPYVAYYMEKDIGVYNNLTQLLKDLYENVSQEVQEMEKRLREVEPPICEDEKVSLIDYRFDQGTPAEMCAKALGYYETIQNLKEPAPLYIHYRNLKHALIYNSSMVKWDNLAIQGSKEAIKRLRVTLLNQLNTLSIPANVREQIKSDINQDRATLGETYLYLKGYDLTLYQELAQQGIGLSDLLRRAREDNVDVTLEENIFQALNIFDPEYQLKIAQLINDVMDKVNNKYGYLIPLRSQIWNIARRAGLTTFVQERLNEIDGGDLDLKEDLGNLRNIDKGYQQLLDELGSMVGSSVIIPQYKKVLPPQVEPDKPVKIDIKAKICNPFNITLRDVKLKVHPNYKEVFGEYFTYAELGPRECKWEEGTMEVVPAYLRTTESSAYLENSTLYINQTASLVTNYDLPGIVINNTYYGGPFEKGEIYQFDFGQAIPVNISLQDAGENQTHKFAQFTWQWGEHYLTGIKYYDWQPLITLPTEIKNEEIIKLAIPDNNTTFMQLYNELEQLNLTTEEKAKLESAEDVEDLAKLKEKVVKRLEEEQIKEKLRERIQEEVDKWNNILVRLDTPLARSIAESNIERLTHLLDTPEKYKLPDNYVADKARKEASRLFTNLKRIYKTNKALSYLNELVVNASAGDLLALAQLEKIAQHPFTYNASLLKWYEKEYMPEYMNLSPKEVSTRLTEISEQWLFNKTKALLSKSNLEAAMKQEYEKAKAKLAMKLEQMEELGADVSEAKEALEEGNLKQAYTLAKKVKIPEAQTSYQAPEEEWNKLLLGVVVIGAAGLVYVLYPRKPKETGVKKLKSLREKIKKE